MTGRMQQDARSCCTRNGQYQLIVTIELPCNTGARPLAVRGVQQFGSGAAAGIACSRRAHYLRRGVRVTLAASAITWHRGMARIDALEYLHTPDIHNPATPSDA